MSNGTDANPPTGDTKSEIELAFFHWIQDRDLFNKSDRWRIAKEFAAIARKFGATDE